MDVGHSPLRSPALPSTSWLWLYLVIGVLLAIDGLGALLAGVGAGGVLGQVEAAGKALAGPVLALGGAVGLRSGKPLDGWGYTATLALGTCLFLGGMLARMFGVFPTD